uniref:Uncharacterized protein n=1 Tax=viral metagenome TaxID=1070528 RepID=A0A6M3JP23_9ZZZZ
MESFEWIAAVAQLGGGACALAAIWMFRPLIERFMGALEASQGRIDEAAALVHRSRESVDQLESTIAALPDRMREAMDRRIDSHSVACGNRRAGETELERLRRLG